MDSFGSDFSSGAAGSGKMDPGTIMEQVKVQIAVANAQELLQRMTTSALRSASANQVVLWTIPSRNASPCVWIATWTRGTPSHGRTTPDCSGRERAFNHAAVRSPPCASRKPEEKTLEQGVPSKGPPGSELGHQPGLGSPWC